jgi:hypothetical protein
MGQIRRINNHFWYCAVWLALYQKQMNIETRAVQYAKITFGDCVCWEFTLESLCNLLLSINIEACWSTECRANKYICYYMCLSYSVWFLILHSHCLEKWEFTVLIICCLHRYTNLTNYLTKSIEQLLSWEINNSSFTQEMSIILRNPKVHFRVHKEPTYGNYPEPSSPHSLIFFC